MKMISLFLPERYLEGLHELVRRKLYPNRAEAIRLAIRNLLNEEIWKVPKDV